MGQEIVYCFQCQGRILGAYFDRGHAYQLGQRFVCSGCAAAVLPTLPLKERERLMADMFKSTRDRRSTSSSTLATQRSLPAPDRVAEGRKTTGRIPIVKRPPPGPAASAPVVLIAAVAIGAAVTLLLWALFGSPSPAPVSVEPVRIPRAAPPPPSPPEDPRTAAAREALARAESFAALHPREIDAVVQEWEAAAKACEDTGYSRNAALRLAEAVRRRTEAFDREVAELDSQSKVLLAAEEYKKAADLFRSAEGRHAHPDWAFAIGKKAGDLPQQAARQLETLKDKASLQQCLKDPAAMARLQQRVEKWGYPELLADLKQAVAVVAAEGSPWTPMLHGKWTDALVKEKDSGWAWEGDALVSTKANPRPARSWQDFENGEFRVRFDAAGTTYAHFSVRQSADGECMVQILRPVFENLAAGEHVLVITFRGPALNATLDDKPLPVELHKRPTTGAFHFAPGNGKFRITSVEYRP